METKLTAENVERIIKDSLNGKEDGAIIVDGVIRKFGFSPDKIAAHKDEIVGMLHELPSEFQMSSGGGWSFLNMCMTRDGIQWGEHRDMEGLCALAIAADAGKFLMPREMWEMLPGGMPYFGVTA